MKIWKSKRFWQVILMIGILPFLSCLLKGLDGAINGISFLWGPADYGWEGFLTAIVFFSYLFWPAYLIGLILIMISVFALVYRKYK